MKDTDAGTLQAGAVWTSLPLPQAMSGVFPLVQCHGGVLQPYMHIPAKFRQAQSSPSEHYRGRTCHYIFSLRCSSLTFNNFQNHKKVRRTEISLKGQTS